MERNIALLKKLKKSYKYSLALHYVCLSALLFNSYVYLINKLSIMEVLYGGVIEF